MDEIIKKVQYPDSVEFGTAKGGVIKVYYDASNLPEAKIRINNAKEALDYLIGLKVSVEVKP
jgi:hypothetical protein